MLQQVPGNDLAELYEYGQLFSKEEQARSWQLPTQGIFQNFNTDLNLNPTWRKNMS